MGNGNHVKFWLDTWLTGFCLANSYSALFHLSSSKSGFVSQMGYWLEDTWYWNLKWRRPLKASETLMVQRLMSYLNLAAIHRLKEDRLIWEWGKDGDDIVNSCMLALERIRYAGSTTYVTNVWKSICPPKIEMTLWLALNEGLCTRAFLVKRHVLSPQEDRCPFYEQHSETVSHILLHCQVVWKLWNKIVAWRGLSWVMSYGLDDLQCQWLGLLQGNHCKFERSVWEGFMFTLSGLYGMLGTT
jgi:hypothetical protein